MLRNGEQLLLAIVIPVIVLVGGVAAAGRIGLDLDGHRAVDVLTPGVLALAVMSTAFTSVAIATGFERRYGVIKLLGSSPLPRHGLLLGKVVALLNVVALQLVVLVVVGLALGWRADARPPAARSARRAAPRRRARHRGLRRARPLRRRRAPGRGHPRPRQPRLPAADGGRRRRAADVAPTAPRRRRSSGCPRARSARRCARRSSTPTVDGRSLLVLAAWAVVGTVLTARTFRWE